jgi:arylsulfatase A-like enzyme
MSIYGYKRHTTPNLDRFAKQSIFFEHGYSSGTNTGHSFSSIMRSAQGDGIFDNSVPTVAKMFVDKGYQTAFITSPKTKTWLYKGRWFEYKQIMMESYQEITHEEARFWKADEMTNRSIDLLKRMKDKGPFFAWIHYTDPHAPYEAHVECGYGETDPDIYDSEITFTDLHIGRLLAYMRESGLLNNTLIAFTSDHGEGFNEHGALEHGCLPYIEQVFVPFWVYVPGAEPKRLAMPVSHVDIAPTMLAYAGITPPDQYEGIDLAKLARGEAAPHPHVICETPRNIPEGTFFAWSLIEGDWKIIYDRVGSNWQLYHLKGDPLEQRNLADLEPQKFSDLKQKLGQYLATQAQRKDYSNWRRFEFRFGS